MPGQAIEVEGALDEGVDLLNSWGPEEILTEDGHVVGMKLRKVLSRFDDTGKWNPQYSDERLVVPCQDVIFAVGQRLQVDFLEDSGVEFDRVGRPIIDRDTGECGVPGLFFAGDVGHRSQDRHHRHRPGPRDRHLGPSLPAGVRTSQADRLPPVHPPQYYLQKLYAPSPDEAVVDTPGGRRVPMPEADGMARRHTSGQVELGWPEG